MPRVPSGSAWCTKSLSRINSTRGFNRSSTTFSLGGPGAQSAAKRLIETVANQPITRELMEETAVRIAEMRSDPEAVEGLSAFLEKRPPDWVPQK